MSATILTSDRLLLRPPRAEDADAIFERYAADPEVVHNLRWATHRDADETRAFLSDPKAEKSLERWVICLDGDPLPSGMISSSRGGPTRELGFVLSRDRWGQGVMTEATRLVLASLWTRPKVWRVQAHAHVENLGSQRVLEKAGLRREGVLRRAMRIARTGDTPQDAVLFAQVRDDLGPPAAG